MIFISGSISTSSEHEYYVFSSAIVLVSGNLTVYHSNSELTTEKRASDRSVTLGQEGISRSFDAKSIGKHSPSKHINLFSFKQTPGGLVSRV